MAGIFTKITRTILEEMKKGNLVWRRPWVAGLHRSVTTKKPYSGINQLTLTLEAIKENYKSPFWGTFDGIRELGGTVRKGEKGTLVVFFKKEELITGLSEETKEEFPELWETLEDLLKRKKGIREKTLKEILVKLGIRAEEVEGGLIREEVPVLKTYWVFNIDQTEGIEIAEDDPTPEVVDEKLSKIISLPQVKPHFSRAFYVPSEDTIYIPPPSQFESKSAYYGTFFHELIHWTGKRLGRQMGIRGSEEYAYEELVAELGSAFLAAEVGVEIDFSNTAAYVSSWVRSMERDSRYIFKAARDAMKAVRWILKQTEKKEEVAA